MPAPSWRIVITGDPTADLGDMPTDYVARQVRAEITAFINSSQYLPMYIESVTVEHDEENS